MPQSKVQPEPSLSSDPAPATTGSATSRGVSAGGWLAPNPAAESMANAPHAPSASALLVRFIVVPLDRDERSSFRERRTSLPSGFQPVALSGWRIRSSADSGLLHCAAGMRPTSLPPTRTIAVGTLSTFHFAASGSVESP